MCIRDSLEAGLNPTAVRDIVNGKSRMPKGQTLKSLAQVLNVRITDLLGVDTISPDELGNNASAQDRLRWEMSRASFHVLEYDVGASAGSGLEPPVLNGDSSPPVLAEWSMPRDMVLAHTTPDARLAVVRVEGDSMEPEYLAGDRVLVDLSRTLPSPPGVFVVWDGIGLVLKRVELVIGPEPRRVRLSSINPAYVPYEVPLQDLHISGRVIGKWMWR
jgi:hypothetical protein